jgi:hypothetical protein
MKMVSVGLSGRVSSTIQSIIVLPPTGNRHLYPQMRKNPKDKKIVCFPLGKI